MKSFAPPLHIAELARALSISVPEHLTSVTVTGLNTLGDAQPTEASFLARPKFKPQIAGSRACLILVPSRSDVDDPRVLRVPDVWLAVVAVLNHFYPPPPVAEDIHPTAIVPESATLGRNVRIGANTVLGEGVTIGDGVSIGPLCSIGHGVEIGDGSFIYDRVTVAAGTVMGRRVMVHSGSVLGADGFKYEVTSSGLLKIPQVGHVVIEDDVEIGANCTIDRASFSVTRIGARTKLDNMVHIAHNCDIGSDCLIAAQCGIAGSTKVGRGVMMGGQVGVADNTTIGDGVGIAAKAGVRGELEPKSKWAGAPAFEARVFNRAWAIQARLPELYQHLRARGLVPTEVEE